MKATVLQIPLRRIAVSYSDADSIADSLFKEGQRWEDEGDLEGALECYRGALEKDNEHFDYLLHTGIVESRTTHYFADAIYHLKSALRINQDSYEANMNLGVMLDGTGNEYLRAEAMWYYQESIRISPEEPTPYYRLGLIHRDMRSPMGALAFFDAALERAKDLELKQKISKEKGDIIESMFFADQSAATEPNPAKD